MKTPTNRYFYLTRGERRGTLFLLTLILLSWAVRYIIPRVAAQPGEPEYYSFPEPPPPEAKPVADSLPYPAAPKPAYPEKAFPEKRPAVRVDINRSEEADWDALRGIGPYYARKILFFREKLGGFYSVDQVGETYGLPDSVFQSIRPFLDPSPVYRKILVNEATEEEMNAHPYISFKQARWIASNRPFDSLAQIRAGGVFSDSAFLRLEPYLER